MDNNKFLQQALNAAEAQQISPDTQAMLAAISSLGQQLDLLIQLECGFLSHGDMKQRFVDFFEQQRLAATAQKLGVR